MRLQCVLVGMAATAFFGSAAQATVTVPPPGNPPWVADRPGLAVDVTMEPARGTLSATVVDLMPAESPLALAGPAWALQPPQRVDDRAAAYRSLIEANSRAAVEAQARVAVDTDGRARRGDDRWHGAPLIGLQLSPMGWHWALGWTWGFAPGLSVWWPGFGLHHQGHHGDRGRR